MENIYFRYKDRFSLEERTEEAKIIKSKSDNKVPIIIEKHPKSQLEQIPQFKFLMIDNLKMYQLNKLIRNKMTIKPSEALFNFANDDILIRGDQDLKHVYETYKSSDGFLYLSYYESASLG